MSRFSFNGIPKPPGDAPGEPIVLPIPALNDDQPAEPQRDDPPEDIPPHWPPVDTPDDRPPAA